MTLKKKLLPTKLGMGSVTYSKSKLSRSEEKKLRLSSFEYAFYKNINFFDTAEIYENGNSEKVVGNFLKNKRSKVFLSSKYSTKNKTKSDIIRACENSLRRLNTDYIDLYQSHWPDPEVNFKEHIEALAFLHSKKKIRYIGLSNCNLEQITYAKSVLGKKLFSNQDKLNLTSRPDDFKKNYFKKLKKIKVKNIAYGIFGQGFLEFKKEAVFFLDKLSKKYNCSLNQLIINWISMYDPEGLILTNSLNPTHIKSNCLALSFRISRKDYHSINNFFQPKKQMLSVNKIKVIDWDIDKNHKVYTSLAQAKANKYGLKPSLEFLVEEIKKTGFKPIEVKRVKDAYFVLQGRMRYWAYRELYKKKLTIPAIIIS